MDVNQRICGIAGSGLVSCFAGGGAGGALTRAMMSKNVRGFATTAATVGGLAAVDGLRWKGLSGVLGLTIHEGPDRALTRNA
ncbi:MAG: hypothetical protein ACI9DC_003785 [Gammaproteobacteria bacterium]|jgi:hypothetical protein